MLHQHTSEKLSLYLSLQSNPSQSTVTILPSMQLPQITCQLGYLLIVIHGGGQPKSQYLKLRQADQDLGTILAYRVNSSLA